MDSVTEKKSKSGKELVKAYAILFSVLLSLWVFGAFVGPWVAERIPVFNHIVEVAIEQDTNVGGYFYSEIEETYQAERYLMESLKLAEGKSGRWGLPFVSGIVICLLILWFGFRKLPLD